MLTSTAPEGHGRRFSSTSSLLQGASGRVDAVMYFSITWGSINSESVGLGEPKAVSHQLPGTVDATGLWTMFWVARW